MCNNVDFSSIAFWVLLSITLAFFIIFADWCPTYPLSILEPELLVLYLVFSILSDHFAVFLEATSSLFISFINFSFWVCSKLSWASLFFFHEVKFPLCISIFVLFIEIIWSTTLSKKSLSCDTSMKLFFFFKYSTKFSFVSLSKWFVGSSISKKFPPFRNKLIKSIFICSPPLSKQKFL